MEIKREMQEGPLFSLRQASLPVIAAIGGMVFPALLYWLVISEHAELTSGWAVPMATDIAFAFGCVITTGVKEFPTALKVFLRLSLSLMIRCHYGDCTILY